MSNYRWYKLDNAATIVPATARGSDTRVFRVTCELKEDVDKEYLQEALDQTMEEFPHYNVVLRKGLFWYYLDEIHVRPLVSEENCPACSPLYFSGRRSFLFRVNYFGRRINVEMFHVLADGTGGFLFMKKLIFNYLNMKHGVSIPPADDIHSSADEKNTDAFDYYYTKQKGREQLNNMIGTRAYQIRQEKDDNMQNHLVEGVVSAREMLRLAKEHNTTVGVFVTALYLEAVFRSMPVKDQKYPVVISVPVNLRQYFPSETTRNFFGVINITCHAATYDGTLESILPLVSQSFEEQLTMERIRDTMNSYSALQHNPLIRFLPLPLKDLGIRFFAHMAGRGTTGTLSNLGKITMPEEMVPYIDRFSAFMSTRNMQICLSTFEDKMVFGAVSAYSEHRVLLGFFRRLTSMGLKVEITSNDYDRREGGQEDAVLSEM